RRPSLVYYHPCRHKTDRNRSRNGNKIQYLCVRSDIHLTTRIGVVFRKSSQVNLGTKVHQILRTNKHRRATKWTPKSPMTSQLRYGPDRIPITLADLQSHVGQEWAGIIERLVADLFAMGWNGEVVQVKSKFGELRFYVRPDRTEEMSDRIWK